LIVLDTSFLYALLDARDNLHATAAAWYDTVDEELATTPLVLAEVDHLATARAGEPALRAFRADVAAGAYAVEWWPGAAAETVSIAERFTDLGLGMTDASLVALAARLATRAIASFDERHFRAVQPLDGGPAFTLLPADARPVGRSRS
jgi:predicted nucleic acid-binding protein